MVSGGSGACRSRGSREAMPNPVSLTSSGRADHQDIGRLEVLVDETALVRLAQSRRDADRKMQEAADLHGRAKQPVERLAARILKHEGDLTAVADEFQRSRRPALIQFLSQTVFVS